ncbi:MAG: hypothetical protein D6696_14965 [Acidobacteria bacterium]|nr:MAG: hypothetical protein D6696_14965 [Acidobacteriota bacterium]
MGNVGKYAFIAGLVLAVVAAFIGTSWSWLPWVLAILGLIVGFMNVGAGETKMFLLAAIGLLLSANAVASLPYVGGYLTDILNNVVVFIAAALLIVSLKALFETAKD